MAVTQEEEKAKSSFNIDQCGISHTLGKLYKNMNYNLHYFVCAFNH